MEKYTHTQSKETPQLRNHHIHMKGQVKNKVIPTTALPVKFKVEKRGVQLQFSLLTS